MTDPAAPARVLWVAKGLGRGGMERLLVDTAGHVDRTRFDIEVAYLLPWKDAFVADLEACGVRTHCLGARRTADLAWVVALGRLLRRQRYDLVHTHSPLPAAATRVLLSGDHTPVVHTEHNVWPRYGRVTRWSNAATWHRNRLVIAVSDGVAASIRVPAVLRRGVSPAVEVMVQGINVDRARHGEAARSLARQRLGLPVEDGELVVGTVGNLTAKKNHALLLDAVAQLRRTRRVRAVVVGSGPLEGALNAQARRLGITDATTFLGSRDDVFELLPGFDVFVLSSTHEGLPIALLEAMASGLPAVATKVGGVSEVLGHEQEGLLVASGDVAGLTAALARLAEEPDLRAALGQRATKRASAFGIGPVAARTQQLYDRVLGARAAVAG